MKAKRVVIVGAGIVGLCCARALRRRGCEVTVLEREAAGHAGCSHGNAGMIVPSHFIPLAAPGMVALGLKWMLDPKSPFYIRPRLDASLVSWCWRFMRAANTAQVDRAAPILAALHRLSRGEYERLFAVLGIEDQLVRKGLLMLCRTEHALADEARVAARARTLDIPARVLTPAEAAQIDPGIRMAIAGAVHFPLDCHLDPARLLAALHARLEAEGVRIQHDTPVTGWTQAGGAVQAVRTPRGEIAADEFVLAGGIWSTGLGRDLGLKLPMQAGKGYSVTLPRPRQLPELCSVLVEARVAVTPLGGALRVGGTMELSGLDPTVRAERVAGILEAIPRYFPELAAEDFRGLPVWQGFRPCTPDGLPYLGRCGPYRNLTAATGHAMMGVSLAPITGRLVAEIVAGENPAVDLRLLDPNRYS